MYQLSRYNKYIRYKNKFLYFNALTQCNFLMTSEEHDKIQEQLKDPITFALQYPTVFAKFKSWGFIIESDVSEFDVIRFRHFSELFSPASYHMVINICDQMLLDGKMEHFVLVLGRFIKNMIKNRPKPICLEWILGDAVSYKEITVYTNKYIKQLCSKNEIPLYSQADLTDAELDNNMVAAYKNIDLKNFRLRVLIAQKSREEHIGIDDLPKLNWLIEKIHTILQYSDGTLLIDAVFQTEIPVEKTVAFFNRICTELRNRIQVVLVLHGKTTIQQYHHAVKEVSGLGFNLQPIAWKNMTISPENITITTDGNVFFDRYVEYDETRKIGKLNPEGIIEWDEVKKAFYYGRIWFDNEQCKECPYLYIMRDFCKDYVFHYGNRLVVNCPMKNGITHGDQVLVGMYETKHFFNQP